MTKVDMMYPSKDKFETDQEFFRGPRIGKEEESIYRIGLKYRAGFSST